MSKEHTYLVPITINSEIVVKIKSELEKAEMLEELSNGGYQYEIKKQIQSPDLEWDFTRIYEEDIKEL